MATEPAATRRPMRILVVGERFPWPEDHGAAMRLANVIHGLSLVGDVELFSLIHPEEAGACQVPSRVPLSRYATAIRTAVPLTKRLRLAWFARGAVPLELFDRDYGPARAAFGAWARESYDLAWFGDPEALVALGRQVRAPAIVDFDDLEDHTAWLKGHDVGPTGKQSALRRAGTRVADAERLLRHRKNARLWRKLQERAVRSVAAVVVCSELDRTRFGRSSVVIPNGYTLSGPALGRLKVGTRPTILLPGYLRYGPNVDAARRLVQEIGPHLWARAPDLQIRLVGLADKRITQLHRPPAVVVTGRVDDMATELARADLLAVPLRYGGGTRIKILEAFAHRIPVVSTVLGAEGLEVKDGEHLLLRDEPADFAAACLSLLHDEERRAMLVASASELFTARYRWEEIQRQIADAGRSVLDARRGVHEPG